MTLEQLALDVDQLTRPAGLLDQLEALLPEPVGDPTAGSQHRTRQRVAGSSAPWHAEAAAVYFTIHAGARDLEAGLRYRVTGTIRDRGGSSDNTREALSAVVNLAYAADDQTAHDAGRQVAAWCRQARQVGDIAEQDRWSPLPRRPGQLPPPCPYCQTYSLRMSRRAGEVRCANRDCVDSTGRRPLASMDRGRASGTLGLVFRDGLEVTYTTPPDVDDQGDGEDQEQDTAG